MNGVWIRSSFCLNQATKPWCIKERRNSAERSAAVGAAREHLSKTREAKQARLCLLPTVKASGKTPCC